MMYDFDPELNLSCRFSGGQPVICSRSEPRHFFKFFLSDLLSQSFSSMTVVSDEGYF